MPPQAYASALKGLQTIQDAAAAFQGGCLLRRRLLGCAPALLPSHRPARSLPGPGCTPQPPLPCAPLLARPPTPHHLPRMPPPPAPWDAALGDRLSSPLLRSLVTPGQAFPDMAAALAEMQARGCLGAWQDLSWAGREPTSPSAPLHAAAGLAAVVHSLHWRAPRSRGCCSRSHDHAPPRPLPRAAGGHGLGGGGGQRAGGACNRGGWARGWGGEQALRGPALPCPLRDVSTPRSGHHCGACARRTTRESIDQ